MKNERSERSDSENRYVSSTFTVLSTENINLRYTSSTRFIFIKILNILSELYEIVKKETVRNFELRTETSMYCRNSIQCMSYDRN